MQSGIYKIINIEDGKVYIGSAVWLQHRWIDHRSQLNNNIHYSTYLQNAWNKYGENGFKFETVEVIEDKTKLIEREQYWINYYRSYERDHGYNLSPTAGSRLGSKQSDAVRSKISSLMLGKKHKFAKRNRGPLSQETKNKISNSMKNRFDTHACTNFVISSENL
jgi:group I intron endonuclease